MFSKNCGTKTGGTFGDKYQIQLKISIYRISVLTSVRKIITAWNVSRYEVMFGLYFPALTRTEYGETVSLSPYSVQILENADQKLIRIWTLFTQWIPGFIYPLFSALSALNFALKTWFCSATCFAKIFWS